MITPDADQAARAPLGDAIIGDPVAAMGQLYRLAQLKPSGSAIKGTQPAASSSTSGKITVKQFTDVLAQVPPPDAVFTSEAFSPGSWWEQISLNGPRSFYGGAAGTPGFALPA